MQSFGVPYEMASFTKHKARVVLLELLLSTVLIIKTFGGEVGGFGGRGGGGGGGEFSFPSAPPSAVDETLLVVLHARSLSVMKNSKMFWINVCLFHLVWRSILVWLHRVLWE